MDNTVYARTLITKYFEDKQLLDSAIRSFNAFVDTELNRIVEENKYVEPTIIPESIDEFKIRFDSISVGKPEITEADGSKRTIYPYEARLRKLTYAAPLFIEVSTHINGVQRETFKTQIGYLPIMLKSKRCHLHGLPREELIKHGEDPDDPGGYFIINGSEKVLINVEDLAPNTLMVDEQSIGPSKFVGKLFSESGSYRIPHTIEQFKDGVYYLSFTRVKRIPMLIAIKALGLLKDKEITDILAPDGNVPNTVLLNLYQTTTIKSVEDALDYIAKKIGITQSKEIRVERAREIMTKYLLPHIGTDEQANLAKAYNLCKMLRRYIRVAEGQEEVHDKDHYMNKRIKMPGDLLAELFRANMNVLIGDLLYNFQRIVKRGKFPSIKVVIREKLLTQRLYSSMATGNWIGGRKGISQRIQRLNFLDTVSHLQRVVSPLSSSQENFEARELHSTHLGRLCPLETPEGTNIGLRKNLAMMASISADINEEELVRTLKTLGVKTISQ